MKNLTDNNGIVYDTKMKIVIDTNVFISALKSKRGAAYRLLKLVGTGRFSVSISVPIIFEYDDVAKRRSMLALTDQQIDDIINYLCLTSEHVAIFYLWRPVLSDPKDDFVLELAVNAAVDCIVTFNVKDFQKGQERFGIEIVTPQEFLLKIGEMV